MIFEGDDTLSNFCGWVLVDDNKGGTCIAHNFGGYDGRFILRHILEKRNGETWCHHERKYDSENDYGMC